MKSHAVRIHQTGGPEVLTWEEVDVGEPGPGQVLVEPIACGICGSDLHTVDHVHDLVESAIAGGSEGFAARLDPDEDLVMGHELSCRVLEVGPGVTDIREDLTYAAMPFLETPDGPVTPGYDNQYPGGYSDQMLLSPVSLVPIPNGLDPTIAALTEPMAVGLHAVNESSMGADRIAVVIGAGPVGLAIIAALAASGVKTIIASDFSPTRRATAEAMGLTFDEMVDLFAQESAIKRPNTVEEVAALAVLLASDAGAGITGATLSVDGGTTPY